MITIGINDLPDEIISRPIFLNQDARYANYKIGKYTYGMPFIVKCGNADTPDSFLEIGAFVAIAPDVIFLLDGEHRTDYVSIYPFDCMFKNKLIDTYSHGKITVGNDVWIGEAAMILSGVTIGDGAVIGARTVVAKDVPPYAIVVGSPQKLIRYRFSKEIIDELLKIKWWEWEDQKIRDNVDLLFSTNILKFVNRHRVEQ